MTKRVSNSRASQHNGPMGRQVSKMTNKGRARLTAEARKALEHSAAPGNMRMAARAMIEAIGGGKSGGAHRKAAGRGS